MVSILKKIGQFILDTIQAIVMAFTFFIFIYWFLFAPHQVKGSSMFPTLKNGEFLLTNKISYRFNQPQRGDIIVFKAPKSEPCSEIECEYIKRIIGLPGDKVKVSGGKVYVNGDLLNESSYLPSDFVSNPGGFLAEGVDRIVPNGYVLPLGDNRPYSRDGREFGPVSEDSIVGKAWIRYWPVNQAGVIAKATY